MEQKFSSLGEMEAANHSKNSAVETRDHFKNEASSKSQMSRRNRMMPLVFSTVFFVLSSLVIFVMYSCDSSPQERKFEKTTGCGDDCTITVSRTSEGFRVWIYSPSNSLISDLSVSNLKLEKVRNDNSEFGIYNYVGRREAKIGTYRPLEDFITNGVSSDKKMNTLLRWEPGQRVLMKGPDVFVVER